VVKNWVSLAEYDFETAKAMMKSKRYIYVVFLCQQTIEKLLKALYVKEKNETPPYTHNLIRLIESLTISPRVSESQKELLEYLNSYYFQSRYSEYFEKLSKSIPAQRAKSLLKRTEELYKWLISLI